MNKIYFSSPTVLQNVALNIYGYWQANKRFGGDFFSILEDLETSQWWSPSQLEDFQHELLQNLIRHAYENVPYYNRVFRERKLKPSDIKTKDDLAKLPFLTKSIINEHFEELIAKNVPSSERVLHHTGGTTGHKLKGFYLNKELLGCYKYAVLYRYYRWSGFDVGDKRVTIAGRFFANRPPYWRLNRAENQLLLSTHHLNSLTVGTYIEKIKEFSPKALQVHPSAINYLAKRMDEKEISIPVKAILTTGEQLYSDQRELIEKKFQCEIFDSWGQGERVAMAAECGKHEGYHISSEYGIVEIISNETLNDSNLGEIIATSLHNYAMPFIRYRTGDLGDFADADCSCGRGLPLLRKIEGRVDEVIFTLQGEPVLPVSIRTSLAKFDFLDQYQLIQKGEDSYQILVVGSANIGQRDMKAISGALRYYLGSSANINVKVVSEIPRTPWAKQRLILNQSRRIIK